MLEAVIPSLKVSGKSSEMGESLGELRRYVGDVGRLAGLDDAGISGLRLSVDEIATNIIMYGYKDLADPPIIEATATLTVDTLTFCLLDTSPPFDPRENAPNFDPNQPVEERPIGGMGIYLASNNVDSLSYERVGGVNRSVFVVQRRKVNTNVEKLTDQMERIVLPLGIALASETDFDRLLERILTEAKKICNADAGTLYLRKDDVLEFNIVITDSLGIHLGGTSGKPVTFTPIPLKDASGEPNIRNVASCVALTGETINVPDMYAAQGFDFAAAKAFDKQTGYRSISNLTVPFKDSAGDVVGVMQLLNARDSAGIVVPFDAYNELMVEILSSQAAVALNTQLYLRQQQELLKMQNDMQIARTIQANFIPSVLPEVRGWELSGKFQPARDVSGDFYDVFNLTNKKVAVMIGDVCDKGVGAALFMSLTRSLMRAFSMQQRNVTWATDALLDRSSIDDTAIRRRDQANQLAIRASTIHTAAVSTNAYVMEHHSDLMMFTTLFIGMIDPLTGLLTYINCGHTPPMILTSTGSVRARLKPSGPAIGLYPDAEFTVEEIKLERGETLLCFTDGLTDARNSEGTLFGEPALESLAGIGFEAAGALVDGVVKSLKNYIGDAVQYDDITLIATRRK
jgi:sigma-B regulation protein RsbU (phosphoserine phosphatase)